MTGWSAVMLAKVAAEVSVVAAVVVAAVAARAAAEVATGWPAVMLAEVAAEVVGQGGGKGCWSGVGMRGGRGVGRSSSPSL